MKNTRFIGIEAADLYYACVYKKPLEIKNGKYTFDDRYCDILPPNLDLYYLQSQGKFKPKKLGDECYSDVFVNVSFKYPLMLNEDKEHVYSKEECKEKISIKTIREYLYLNGFSINEKDYVRYKRSSGAAKGGSCLFIRKDLSASMKKWSRTGLDEAKDLCLEDLTSYEAYKALSLSSLIATLDLNPYNILFVKDAKVTLKSQKVVRVYHDAKTGLNAEESLCDIENNIFDGEGLLDVSVFKKMNMQKKGMMLLRSRFFKCCAFNTNLRKWFKDHNITSLDQLNGITFAKSIDDIVLIASESCLKYLKMCRGGFLKENIYRWCEQISADEVKFGVVKNDKPTRFFDGEMVETTYQLLNSLRLKQTDIRKLVAPSFAYFKCVRDIKNTPEFIRFYLEGEDNSSLHEDYGDDSEDTREISEEMDMLNYSSYSFKNKVLLELMKVNKDVKYTDLFKKRIFSSVVDSILLKFYKGRILVNGTYATLFGNPYEFLRYTIKEFDPDKPTSLLKEGEICSSFFEDGKTLVGSRAPHTTMGNVLLSKNVRLKEIDEYFNLTKQIVVVDAINNNIQQRLSGCDYDSDTLLLTDDDVLVSAASKYYDLFLVPYADFSSNKKPLEDFKDKDKKTILALNLCMIDNQIANNIVGGIVNLSQLLNSHLWNTFKNGKNETYRDEYNKIAILSVLSGAEIDSAKRSFPFNTTEEYNRLRKYAKEKKDRSNRSLWSNRPLFFAILEKEYGHKPKISKIKKKTSEAKDIFKTSMDYLWNIVSSTELDSKIRTDTISFFELIRGDLKTNDISGAIYNQVNEAVKILEDANNAVVKIRDKIKETDFELKKMNFNNEIKKAYEELGRKINSEEKVKLIIKALEDKKDGYSKTFIFLYILSGFSNNLNYTLKTLFGPDAKPMPTLRRTFPVETPQYTLFNKYHYKKQDK